MEENVVFFQCRHCRNLIGLIDGNPENIICCGEKMLPLTANREDATKEKHLPVYEKNGNEIIVKVGSILHPMDEDHYIMWIAQVSKDRTTRVRLSPNKSTETHFPYIPGSSLYSYCNKHGLWKTEVE